MKFFGASIADRSLLYWVWLPLLLFFGASILAIQVDFWPVLLLPVLLMVVYFVIKSSFKAYFFLLFLIPLSVPITDIGNGFGLSLPAEPLIWLFFSLSIVALFLGKNTFRERLNHPISRLIFLYILWLLVTTFSSSMPLISFKFSLAITWYVVVFFVLPLHLFRNVNDAHKYIQILMFGTVFLVGYTLFQHAGGGFSRPFAHTAMRPFLPDHGVYAALLSFFIPYGIVVFIYGRHFNMSMVLRIILALATLIMFVGVIFSFTRASWISIVVALGVMMLMWLRVRLWMFVSTLGLIVAVTAFYWGDITNELSRNTQGSDDDFAKHLSSVYNIKTDPSNLERLNRWDCAVQMVKERPVFGFGPGTYTFQYGQFQKAWLITLISTHAGDVGNVHSEILRPMAESGWPGFALFVLIFISLFAFAWKLYLKIDDPKYKYLILGIAGGMATYFFHGLVNNYLDYDKIAAVFWGMSAILIAIRHWSREA